MLRKGKFKLFSYIIDEYLLYYRSLNRKKKLLAFSIIETKEFQPLISILNKFLSKKYLNCYSIQLDVNEQDKNFLILNFEDNKKERIIKFFNLIRQKILGNGRDLHFLKGSDLEKRFKSIIIKEFASSSSILKNHDKIIIKNESKTTFYTFYFINLDKSENKITFIHNFLKLTRTFNQNGHLIFNIKTNFMNNIIVSPFFISKSENEDGQNKFEEELNEIYKYDLIEKQKIEKSKIYLILWRFNINNNRSYFFNNVYELFLDENQYNFKDLHTFNTQFESNLLKKKLKFKRLSKDLLFIEQDILFFTTSHFNPELLCKLLERYYSKYFIYFLLLNERDYNELIEIGTINLLDNVKVINPSLFSYLNLNEFKSKSLLKNTQVDGNILSRIVRM